MLIKEFIDRPVADALLAIAQHDPTLNAHSHAVLDASGRESRLTLWYTPGDDPLGRLSCCREIVESMSAFLDGRASFFHAKVMQKLPHAGGRWEWHQDYGYWYNDGFLRPLMGSCYIALEAATIANGCLQVVPGSHHYGRIDHDSVGEQAGADPVRVAALIDRLGTVPCEMAAGDALFFHANLLHMSGPNESPRSRLGLISSFFREDNESIHDDARFRNKSYQSLALTDISLEGRLADDLSFLAGDRPLPPASAS